MTLETKNYKRPNRKSRSRCESLAPMLDDAASGLATLKWAAAGLVPRLESLGRRVSLARLVSALAGRRTGWSPEEIRLIIAILIPSWRPEDGRTTSRGRVNNALSERGELMTTNKNMNINGNPATPCHNYGTSRTGSAAARRTTKG